MATLFNHIFIDRCTTFLKSLLHRVYKMGLPKELMKNKYIVALDSPGCEPLSPPKRFINPGSQDNISSNDKLPTVNVACFCLLSNISLIPVLVILTWVFLLNFLT